MIFFTAQVTYLSLQITEHKRTWQTLDRRVYPTTRDTAGSLGASYRKTHYIIKLALFCHYHSHIS